MRTPIFGPAYVSRSLNMADARMINLYPSIVESKQGKDIGALYSTPGLDLATSVGNGPIRALYVTSPNASFGVTGLGSRAYGVSGNQFFLIDTTLTPHIIGTIDSKPAAYVYTISTGTFTTVALPFTPAAANNDQVWITSNGVQVAVFVGISADQQDGYVVFNEPLTYRWWQSNLLDASTIDSLNFASASGNPDIIVAISQIHRELFIHKTYHTEVWVNAGTPSFVFQVLDGVYIETGLVAPKSVQTVGETLMWLGRNSQGENVVVQCFGYNPKRVSNHYIERQIADTNAAADATSYSYQQEGHTFYVLNVGDLTFAYDVTVSEQAGIPIWHQRDTIDGDGVSHRLWADNAILFNGVNLCGDYQSANIYVLNPNGATDNGNQRRWLRSWRALPKPTDNPTRFTSLRIDMETGNVRLPPEMAGTPDLSPKASLRWSDDGGHTWSNGRVQDAGALGETTRRVKFNRLGATRRNSGLDRIFELSSGDVWPAAVIGAELE